MVQLRLFGFVSFNYIHPDLATEGSSVKIVQCFLKISSCLYLIMFILSISHWFALDLLIYFEIFNKHTSTKTYIIALHSFIGIIYSPRHHHAWVNIITEGYRTKWYSNQKITFMSGGNSMFHLFGVLAAIILTK